MKSTIAKLEERREYLALHYLYTREKWALDTYGKVTKLIWRLVNYARST